MSVHRLKETLNKVRATGSDTAKRLRPSAQGWRASRLPWEKDRERCQPQRGCVLLSASPLRGVNSDRGYHCSLLKKTVATPLGLWLFPELVPG